MRNYIVLAAMLGLIASPVVAQECKEIRFGTDAGFAPFAFRDESGEPKGFEIDLIKAICTQQNATCSFVINDFDALIPSLVTSRIDAISAAMSITDERKKQIAFSQSYANPPARFVGQKDAEFQLTKEFLSGKTVGVLRGQTGETYMKTSFGDAVTLQLYDSQDSMTQDLATGRLDFALNDAPGLSEGFLKLAGGEDYAFVGPELHDKLFGDGYGFGLRKDDECRLRVINDGLAAIRKDGTYDKVRQHWFAYNIE